MKPFKDILFSVELLTLLKQDRKLTAFISEIKRSHVKFDKYESISSSFSFEYSTRGSKYWYSSRHIDLTLSDLIIPGVSPSYCTLSQFRKFS